MPELPEVETIRSGLAPVMTGRRISRLDLHRAGLRVPFPPGMAEAVKGQRIIHLSRRAKYLLIHIEGGDLLAVHLGMSGRLVIVNEMAGYNLRPHDHMVIALDDGAGVVLNDARRFGMVLMMAESEMAAHPAFAGIGPEPLSDDFTGDVLANRLRKSRVAIKQALLDQRVVAGVGNIYASEALFEARISPFRAAGDVTKKEAACLTAAIRSVLARAIAAGGSSLKDYRQADGSLGYFQHGFAVYDREGEPCPSCGGNGRKKGIIHKIMQGGRATYYCPRCQI